MSEWLTLIASLEAKPKPVLAEHTVTVSDKMRKHCRELRLRTAQRQREQLQDKILAALATGESLRTEVLAERVGSAHSRSLRDRLHAMADEGMIERHRQTNCRGTCLQILWSLK